MTLGLVHAACWYSNTIEEKEGPQRFPNKTPVVGVHWAADFPLQWFNTFYKITNIVRMF